MRPQHAGQRAHDLALALAFEAAHADDLAAPQLQPGARAAGQRRQAAHVQGQRCGAAGRRRPGARRKQRLQRPADHQRDQPVGGQRGNRLGGHVLAVLEHRHHVAEPEDLVEPVADVEHQLALRLQCLDQRFQLVDLGPVQRRGRLVEDEYRGVGRHPLGDFDQLLLADAQAGAGALRIERDADARQHRLRLGQHAPALQPAQPGRLAAQHQVLGHRQVGQHRQLLKHRGDAGRAGRRRAQQPQRPAVDQQLAGIGWVHTGQQLHQRRLAGAVFTGDGVHRARPPDQADLVQRPGVAKGLADRADGDQFARRVLGRRASAGCFEAHGGG